MATAAAEPGGGRLKVEAAPPVAGEAEEGGGQRIGHVVCVGGVKKARRERICTAKERISRMPPCAAGKRSSIYRGVTRHRWTGRYEAHLWDKSTWNQNQNKKGKQVYLGAYDDEEAAARAYDLAALKYWGAGTLINFPVTDYTRDLEEMQMVSKEDYLVSLRRLLYCRKTSAFARGIAKYRGVSRPPHNYSQIAGSECFNNMNCSTSRDASGEGTYASGFSMGRKIDLTGYIRWWGTKSNTEDVAKELRDLESSVQPTEPYQLPSLGLPDKGKPRALSASSILSRSAAFKNFQERSSEKHDVNISTEVDHGKRVQPSFVGVGSKVDRSREVTLGMDEFSVQRTPYALAPLVSAPLRTNWAPVDPMPDPVFWTSLVPETGLSLSRTLMKNEISSPYPYQCQD